MEAFLVSTGIVALAEIGDKTQLLALALASRFRRPVPIIAGIFVATVVNHAAAGWIGAWVTSMIEPDVLRWILGFSFIAMAAWVLVPDRIEEEEAVVSGLGVFTTTTVSFFLAEMADKTQVATVALAASYPALVAVIAGTTVGMLIANVPVVYLGDRAGQRIPVRLIHASAAVLLAVLGVLTLLG